MADLRASTSIGGSLAWHSGNLRFDTQGNTIRYAGFKIYTENDLPTLTELGAVQKSGDTMTGTLNGTSFNVRNSTDFAAQLFIDWSNDIPRLRVGGSSNANIEVQGSGDALRFTFSPSEAFIGPNRYKVLHTSNINGQLDGRYTQKAAAETITQAWNFTGELIANGPIAGGGIKGIYIGSKANNAYIYSGASWLYLRQDNNYIGINNNEPQFNGGRLTRVNQNEVITGKWNFTALPESTVSPTTDSQLTRKGYVDTQDALKADKTGGVVSGSWINTGNHKVGDINSYSRDYVASMTNTVPIALDNGDALPNGVLRVRGGVSGTSTSNTDATAVFWHTGTTWTVLQTTEAVGSSNQCRFVIDNGVPSVASDHASNYTFTVHHEMNITNMKQSGRYFGIDGVLRETDENLYLYGTRLLLNATNFTSTLDPIYVNKTGDNVAGTLSATKLHANGEITASTASLQVNGYQRTGNIYLHEGANTPNATSAVISNLAGDLQWKGSNVVTVANLASYVPAADVTQAGNHTFTGNNTFNGITDLGVKALYNTWVHGGLAFKDFIDESLKNGRMYFENGEFILRGGGIGGLDAATDTTLKIRYAGSLQSVYHTGNDSNLGRLNRTQTWSSTQTHSTIINNTWSTTASNGRGLRFWQSDSYKIYMSTFGDATWGGQLGGSGDYNMYFRMGGTGRGFVFDNTADGIYGHIHSGGMTLKSNSWFRTIGTTGWYSDTYGGGIHMLDSTWVRIYNGKKLYISNAAHDSYQTSGGINLAQSVSARGYGVTGNYSATHFQGVFAMGSSYMFSADGVGTANAYGIGWTHSNNINGNARKITGHHAVFMQAGVVQTSIGPSIWCIGNITAYSDRRVKTNIEVIPMALDKVCSVSGYTFDRTDTQDIGRQTGVIAQEILEILPEAVTGGPDAVDADGHYSVAYGQMAGLFIEAIKELREEKDTDIRMLSNEVAELKALVSKLINK